MSGGFDAIADIGIGAVLDFAPDLGSLVTDFGIEFLDVSSFTSFEIPGFDVASLGGFDIAGSFAGSAEWFNTFNPGDILSSIPSVGDFNVSSLTSSLNLPSLASLNTSTIINTATSSLGINIPSIPGITGPLNTASLVSAGAAALGINPALLTSASRVLNGASPVSVGAAALGINPAAVTSVTATANNLISSVDSFGLNILNAAGDAAIAKNVNPALINSLTDPSVPNAINAVNAATGLPINTPRPVSTLEAAGLTQQYTETYDPESGTWSVYDNITSTTVSTGLTEQEATLAQQELNITSGLTLNSTADPAEDPFEARRLANIAEGETPINTGLFGDQEAAAAASLTTAARTQQSIRELRNNKAQSSDWRVRLRLAPYSSYLYNDLANLGVLAALRATDGVIFPYTPSIETAYKANYDQYDLTHSNYRGYFYKNSYVDAVNVRATFTAQDTKEADYLLAVIHFFRSVTKMFYGQDQQRGAPPPLVYLSGYGDYQFNEHPCVVSQFNYTLPPDVDYIRAQNNLQSNTNQSINRLRNPIANNPVAYSANRLLNSSLFAGALAGRPAQTSNLANGEPTYVPTKMEIAITLLPIQSRSNISNNFSVRGFANGNLLKDGYW